MAQNLKNPWQEIQIETTKMQTSILTQDKNAGTHTNTILDPVFKT